MGRDDAKTDCKRCVSRGRGGVKKRRSAHQPASRGVTCSIPRKSAGTRRALSVRTFVLLDGRRWANGPPLPFLVPRRDDWTRRSRASGGQEGFEGTMRAVARSRIAQQTRRMVMGEHDAVQVLGELLGVGVRPEMAFFDTHAEGVRQEREPVLL